MEKRFSLGIFYMLLSGIGLSFTIFFSKLGLENLTLTGLIFTRFVASLIFCTIFLQITGKFRKIFPMQHASMHIGRAFFVLLAQYSIFYYLKDNSLLNATVLLNTGPLFIPLIEWLILKHKVGKSTWIGVIVSFVGVVCILQPEKGIFAWDSFIGLLAGLCQGGSQVLFGMNAEKEDTEVGIFYLFGICSIISAFVYFVIEFPEFSESVNLWPVALFIALLGLASTCNQFFRGAAYRHGRPSNLATFLYVSVLLSGMIDWLYFHHIPNTLSIIGGLLVILGGILKVFLRHLTIRRKKP